MRKFLLLAGIAGWAFAGSAWGQFGGSLLTPTPRWERGLNGNMSYTSPSGVTSYSRHSLGGNQQIYTPGYGTTTREQTLGGSYKYTSPGGQTTYQRTPLGGGTQLYTPGYGTTSVRQNLGGSYTVTSPTGHKSFSSSPNVVPMFTPRRSAYGTSDDNTYGGSYSSQRKSLFGGWRSSGFTSNQTSFYQPTPSRTRGSFTTFGSSSSPYGDPLPLSPPSTRRPLFGSWRNSPAPASPPSVTTVVPSLRPASATTAEPKRSFFSRLFGRKK